MFTEEQLNSYRKQAADFLQGLLDNVNTLEKSIPGSFDFSSYVTEHDKEHTCGTVCCMEGWVPKFYPQIAKWRFEGYNNGVFTHKNQKFEPTRVGIPISDSLWEALTVPEQQGFLWDELNLIDFINLESESSLELVTALWSKVITLIRAGQTDIRCHVNVDSQGNPYE